MSKIKDLFDLSVEINSISLMLEGLSNTLYPECDRLTDDSLRTALYGVSKHLDRVAEDLEIIDENQK